MRILALPALYLVYKGLTTGEGVTLFSPVPKTPEQIEQRRKDEVAIEKQKEEDKRKKAEDDRKREEQRREDEKAIERQRQEEDRIFFARQAEIRANPPNCGRGKSPRLRGAGTRNFPYSWDCIVTGF